MLLNVSCLLSSAIHLFAFVLFSLVKSPGDVFLGKSRPGHVNGRLFAWWCFAYYYAIGRVCGAPFSCQGHRPWPLLAPPRVLPRGWYVAACVCVPTDRTKKKKRMGLPSLCTRRQFSTRYDTRVLPCLFLIFVMVIFRISPVLLTCVPPHGQPFVSATQTTRTFFLDGR